MEAPLIRDQHEAERCACCARSLASGLWIEAEEQALCEACYLQGHRTQRELVSVGEAAATLAEALVEALDLREHETGLHSWEQTRKHPRAGHRILSQIPGLEDAAEIVLRHEERYDGNGYPRGLAGDDIPLGARLFAVIDTLDAITSDRPYRRALSFDAAAAEIERMDATQFDPQAVELFVDEAATLRRMVMLKCTVPEPFAGTRGQPTNSRL